MTWCEIIIAVLGLYSIGISLGCLWLSWRNEQYERYIAQRRAEDEAMLQAMKDKADILTKSTPAGFPICKSVVGKPGEWG